MALTGAEDGARREQQRRGARPPRAGGRRAQGGRRPRRARRDRRRLPHPRRAAAIRREARRGRNDEPHEVKDYAAAMTSGPARSSACTQQLQAHPASSPSQAVARGARDVERARRDLHPRPRERHVPRHGAFGLGQSRLAEAVAAGADVVTFSGDKLLGGPQAGIAVGRAERIAALRAHPLMRAVRPDKLTLAGLIATLELYRDGPRVDEIPIWRMIAAPVRRSPRARARSCRGWPSPVCRRTCSRRCPRSGAARCRRRRSRRARSRSASAPPRPTGSSRGCAPGTPAVVAGGSRGTGWSSISGPWFRARTPRSPGRGRSRNRAR